MQHSLRDPKASGQTLEVRAVGGLNPPPPDSHNCEARVFAAQWRAEYNTGRLHGSFNYQPPAPGAIKPKGTENAVAFSRADATYRSGSVLKNLFSSKAECVLAKRSFSAVCIQRYLGAAVTFSA